MSRRPRWSWLVVALLLTAALAPPASAAPPDKGTERSLSFGCGDLFLTNDPPLLTSGGVSSRFGAFGEGVLWASGADPSVDPPIIVPDGTAVGEIDGNTITIDFGLADFETGAPAGTGHIEATLTGTGLVETIEDRFDFGNAFDRFKGTVEEATVTGELRLEPIGMDPIVVDLAGCFGSIATIDFFETNPTAFMDHVDEMHVECAWETALGGVVFTARRFGEDFSFANVFIDPRLVGGSVEGISVTPDGLSLEIPLFDELAGEELPNPATVEASFTERGTEVEQIKRSNGFEKFIYTLYSVSGTLSIPDLGLELDLADCFAVVLDGHFVGVSQTGGPKGKPAVNDAPAGALPLGMGRIQGTTVGTVLDPEVEGSCVPFDPDFGLQLGHTLWYRLTGTGAEVTLDTAGSHFDTVLVVYEAGAELVEIACVDDVPTGEVSRTTNASVTFTAEAGVTYLIQLGGFAGEADRFRLSVR